MLDTQFAVTVLRSPFGVREADFVAPYDPNTAGGDVLSYTDAQVVNRYAQVQPIEANPGSLKRRSYAVGNARGIQLLVASTRSSSLPSPANRSPSDRRSPSMQGGLGAPARLQALSKHEDGRLMLWDTQSNAVLASCLFQPDFTVRHCAATSSFLYNTLEGSAAAAGAEEETCVYIWERRALRTVAVMRGHTARLTAFAICPMETSTLVATASLDGTLRLWRHVHRSVVLPSSADTAAAPSVQMLWVLATAELGTVHSLAFLSSDLLVVAGTRCTMAFVRFPDAPPRRGGRGSVAALAAADALPFQTITSNVDADGGTTFLHVCPYNRVSGAQPLSGGSQSSSPTKRRSPSYPNSPSTPGTESSATATPSPPPAAYSLVHVVTGSTSGYVQEWAIDINADNSAEAQGDGRPAYVGVRCRWYHKAHCATVDCVVTDEDVVVSTSMFDGARLYHRKSGVTCAVTSTAAVPVLVPQRQEVVWGTVDGVVSVASYARFASGAEKELHMLWSAKPHATAVRGICLSLTPDFRWDTLCTGAADGTMCVWAKTPDPSRMTLNHRVSFKEDSTALFHRILHMLPVPPSSQRSRAAGAAAAAAAGGTAAVAAVVAGLRVAAAGKPNAVLVAEVSAGGELLPVAALPYKDGEDVSCAHVLRDEAGAMEVWVGTQSGLLLHGTRKAAQKAWTALKAVHWDAKPRGSVEAITAAPSSAAVAVAVVEAADTRQTAQRLFVSVVGLDAKAPAAETLGTVWEDSVVLPSTITAAGRRQRGFGMTWVARDELAERQRQSQQEQRKSQAEPQPSAGSVLGALLVCGSDGMLIRCSLATTPGAIAPAWQTPELLVVASSVGPVSAVQRNLDATPSSLSTTVVAESGTSDLSCFDVFAKSKRVLLPSKTRMTMLTGPVCDGGSSKVRLVGVQQHQGEATSEALFFDEAGQLSYRVTYEGAVVPVGAAAIGAAGSPAAKEQLNYAPKTKRVVTQRSSVVAAPAALESAATAMVPCTAVAACAAERVVLLGYEDGLLQMVDTTDMYVFGRRWATDSVGSAQSILEVRYGGAGVAVVRLENDEILSFAVPPRSLLDFPSTA